MHVDLSAPMLDQLCHVYQRITRRKSTLRIKLGFEPRLDVGAETGTIISIYARCSR